LKKNLLMVFASCIGVAAGGCVPVSTLVSPPLEKCAGQNEKAPDALRMVTYNIHAGVDSSLDEIGDVLEGIGADVLALQEVDRGVDRTEGKDQAQILAERFGMRAVFAGAMERGGGEFGIALLSRFPLQRVERVDLHTPGAFEPRVAIDATVCVGQEPVRILSAHSDVYPWVADQQLGELAEIVRDDVGQQVVVAGDLNAHPDWAGPAFLRDAGLMDLVGEHAEGRTYRGDPFQRRLDYIWMDPPLGEDVHEVQIVDSDASDHFPVVAEVGIEDRNLHLPRIRHQRPATVAF
jgi:endonuclease/exonuclease/phosphatase family metal-dependent hydrolase